MFPRCTVIPGGKDDSFFEDEQTPVAVPDQVDELEESEPMTRKHDFMAEI